MIGFHLDVFHSQTFGGCGRLPRRYSTTRPGAPFGLARVAGAGYGAAGVWVCGALPRAEDVPIPGASAPRLLVALMGAQR